MKIVITKNGLFRQKWSFKLVGKNGKILMTGEKYYNFKDMTDTIEVILNGIKGCKIENQYLN